MKNFRFSEVAREQQELYQKELVQHGRTMEELASVREREEERLREVSDAKEEVKKLKEELNTVTVSY